MNILITQQEGALRDKFFPEEIVKLIGELGTIRFNDKDRTLTGEELAEYLEDIDVCITHSWNGCAAFSEEVLKNANRLKLIVHPAGSIATFITDSVYDKGIKICSSNSVMARYVAEGTLAYILAALRNIPEQNKLMKDKFLWTQLKKNSLINRKVGLVGLGQIGRFLLEFLKPFDVKIKIYDPYVKPDTLKQYDNLEISTLEDVLTWSEVISLHASRTPETYHMLNKERLKMIKDGVLIVNTARGSLIDEKALCVELKSGRLSAVLDVYEEEPLPLESPLRDMDNVILMPHLAGENTIEYTYPMIDEIKRFINNEPLLYEIPYEQFLHMTR